LIDYPEFKMGSCSVAKIQTHPPKNGFCGEKAHDDFERGLSTRLINGATRQNSSNAIAGDFPPST